MVEAYFFNEFLAEKELITKTLAKPKEKISKNKSLKSN